MLLNVREASTRTISRHALAEIIYGLLIEETDCHELTRSISEGEP